RRLADWGIDSTIAIPWPIEDPRYAPLEAKLDAMQAFAQQHNGH
ncbi:MAG: hypothetical protein H6Q33_5488, partial [Deltaproteobacteria bacterium]|nr:hypothetical protein [Deltaproteobacteria bacterium]